MFTTDYPKLTIQVPHRAPLNLRLAKEKDSEAILDYFTRNRAHFAPTDPAHPAEFYTLEYWMGRARASREEFKKDQSVRLLIFDEDDSKVLGTTNFTQIFRGPLQACFLGYGLDQNEQGKGIMTQALKAGIGYMFDVRGLHRIMANHLPENERSAKVLKRLGFDVEGLAKSYLLINGAWRDHVLNSLVNSNWRAS